MEWIIFTEDQKNAAMRANGMTVFQVRPRLIDQPQHPDAGSYAAPEHVMQVEGYAQFWEGRLEGLPRVEAKAADLFAVVEELVSADNEGEGV